MKRLAVLLVCLTVVLAGCVGAGNGGSGDPGAADGGGDASGVSGGDGADGVGSGADGSDTDGVGSDDAAGDDVANSPPLTGTDPWFDLGEPGRYVFEIHMWVEPESITSRSKYETTIAPGGVVTVEYASQTLEVDGEEWIEDYSVPSNVTGPSKTVEDALFEEDYGASIVPYTLEIAQDRLVDEFDGRLTVGQRVERTVDGNETVLEAVGVDSYAGVDCVVVREYLNGDLRGEVCTSAVYRLVPYVVTYDEAGEEIFRIELVEYERRS